MAQFADGFTSEQDSYRAWQQEQARKAAQAEAAARARAQEQAQAAARAQAAERERAAAQARAAEEARARAAVQAAQAAAAARARAQEQARETARAETAARERAAVQARADEQARARAAAQAEAVARARGQEQAEAAARAQAAERERAAVQARVDERARAQAAAQAEAAARARAQEEAEAAARADVGARERAAVEARAARGAVDGPPPRGTAAYDAYLREKLNATTQGIASGIGSVTEPGEPARRTGPRELTLAEKLRDGFTPGSGARPAAEVADDPAEGPPPRDTPEYYAYLKGVIEGTPQGIAPGVGSFSEVGEPARRTGPRELTLAEKLADGLTPGSGSRPAVKVADASAAGLPPRDTPEYYAYLKGVIEGTPQGIAPGVGSFSDVGEPARRTGPRELTLMEKLADGLTPGSGAREVLGSPREPRAEGQPQMSPEAEQELWDAVLAQEEAAYGRGRSEYHDVMEDGPLWDEALGQEETAYGGGRSAFEDVMEEGPLWDAVLAQEESSADPATGVRYDLLDQLDDMFEAANYPLELTSETYRAFSDDGANRRTADGRFRETAVALGYSSAQIDRLVAGEDVDEVGEPAGGFSGPTAHDKKGAQQIVQVREQDEALDLDLVAELALCVGEDAVFDMIKGGVTKKGLLITLAQCAGEPIVEDFFDHDVAPDQRTLAEQIPENRLVEDQVFGSGGLLDPNSEQGRWAIEAFFGDGRDGMTAEERVRTALDLRGFSGGQIGQIDEGIQGRRAGVPLPTFGGPPRIQDINAANGLLTPPGMEPLDSNDILAIITDPRIRAQAEAVLGQPRR